ncbi:uncharacterized protein [Paralichthys olivaceus]|uniref:uncharacterized protein isoform X6 n=1 Tax=Paralichthys olivaceus TaxID=8255 RepID=UPI00097E0F42|nr:PREDICTED: uncharacterized protein LOC109633150 isoform X3 [Paralichthys olivaceus]
MKLFIHCLLLLPFATMVLAAPIRDTSNAQSTESLDTNGFTGVSGNNGGGGTVIDLRSHEIIIPKAVRDENTPSPRRTGADKDKMDLVDMSRRLDPDQAGRERSDLHREEATTVDTQHGKQVNHLSGGQVSDGAHLQRRGARVNGSNGTLTPGQNRELQDRNSWEQNNGRVATVGNSRYTDYDETREYISSEMYPLGAEQIPSHLSVPAKI